MLPSRFALVALFVAAPLLADTISSEFAVSAAHWQPGDVTVSSAVAVGPTRRFEAVQDGGLIFGNDIAPDGRPDVGTRRLLGPGRLLGTAAVGDEFFVLSDTNTRDTLTLRRASDGKEAQFRITTTNNPGVFRSDGARLWYVYNRQPSVCAIVFDTNLAVAVPEFTVRTVGTVVPGQGAAARGTFLVLLSDNPSSPSGTLTYWTIDGNGKSQVVSVTPPPPGVFASNGSDYLFAFTSKTGPLTNLWAQHYSRAGLPTSDLYPIASGDAQRPVDSPVVASDGTDYYVGWREVTDSIADLYVQRLGATSIARVARGNSLSITGIAAGPAGVLAFWSDATGDAFMRRTDVDAQPSPKTELPQQQTSPSIASDGVTSMVAWAENDVRIGRVARDGTPLDGPGVVISQSPLHPKFGPQILFDGKRYLVFWSEGPLMARYVEGDGRPAGDAFVISPPGQNVTEFSTAFDGERYQLMWRDQRYYAAWFATMDAAGTVTSPTAYYYSPGFAIAAGPHPFFIYPQFSVSYLNADFLDRIGKGFSILTFSGWSMQSVRVASSGSDYVVTWTQSLARPTGQVSNEIWAAHVSADGMAGPQIMIAALETTGGRKAGLAVPLFDGKHYRIVYAAATLGEAILSDDSFVTGRFEHTDVEFDTLSIKQLSAAATAEGSVLAYDRAVTPPSDATHNNVFVRFARVPPPARRRATK